ERGDAASSEGAAGGSWIDESRNSRVIAARGAEDVGSSGVGMLKLAHPVRNSGYDRECEDGGARGRSDPGARLSPVSCALSWRAGEDRDRAGGAGARIGAGNGACVHGDFQADGLPLRDTGSRRLPPGIAELGLTHLMYQAALAMLLYSCSDSAGSSTHSV